MKTSKQLYDELLQLAKNDPIVRRQGMFNMQPSGDIAADLSRFTDLQGGGRSADPNDNAARFPPPQPHKDGVKYHTVRDITWATFKSFFPALGPDDFYDMTDANRTIIIKRIMTASNETRSPAINALLSYIAWGSGSYSKELLIYLTWYKSNYRDDIAVLGEKVVFDRLTDIRKYRYSMMDQVGEYPGWIPGLINFWRVFRQHCIS